MNRLLVIWALACAPVLQASAALVETGGQAQFSCPDGSVRTVRQPLVAREAASAAGVGAPGWRVAIWGDSHTASRDFAEAMLAAMQVDAAEVQPTFLAASWASPGVAQPLRTSCASNTWRSHSATRWGRQTGAGLMALSADAPGSLLAFDFRWPTSTARIDSARLHIGKLDPERTLLLAVSADGGPETLVSLGGAVQDPLRIELTRPAATLQLRLVAGELSVYGISPVYLESARHRLDVFSFPGATVGVWTHASLYSPAFLATRPPIDLAVLQYGTNDAVGIAGRFEGYLATLRSALRRFRLAYPGVRCVLLGPPDRGGRSGEFDMSQVHAEVARLQQRTALEFGCDFWDWQAQMGGLGSARAGAARTPPSMVRDLVHLTSLGYRDSGHAFGLWLARSRR